MTQPSAPPPRSTAVPVVCWVAILAVVAFVMVGHARKDRATATGAGPAATGGPGFELVVTGRTAVAVAQNPATTGAFRQQLLDALDRLAPRPVDRLAVATVVRELSGPAAALKRVDGPTFSPDPQLRADAAALAAEYRADSPAVLTQFQRAALARDLGYFGRLAVTQGGPPDGARQAVLAEARRTSVALTIAGILAAATLFVGVLGLATGVVLFAVGVLRLAYVPPTTDRPVWLETFAVWIVAFVLLGVVAAGLSLRVPLLATESMAAGLTAAVALGWPAWRAQRSVADIRRTLGWHRGRGILIELACGVAGYVAGLPVLAVGLLLTLGLTKLAGAHPSHPIVREFGEGMSAGHVLALLVTAAVLAPMLEETMFRGALYGHLRRRHRAWVSAAVVAVLFAAIHPQGWTAIPLLGSIALVLAFLREWRGSLIAPITAHAINNGVVVAVVAAALG